MAEQIHHHFHNEGVGIREILPLTTLEAARRQRSLAAVVWVSHALHCGHGLELDITNSADRDVSNNVDRAIVSGHILRKVVDGIGQAIHIGDSHEHVGQESADGVSKGARLDVGLKVVVLTNLGPK